jgi:hypothetical protein
VDRSIGLKRIDDLSLRVPEMGTKALAKTIMAYPEQGRSKKYMPTFGPKAVVLIALSYKTLGET